MIGPIDSHTMAIKDVVCGNLLQITFLSDHVVPNLYTYTILSLWATANFVESGLKAIWRIVYDSLPLLWSNGFVANLSRFSPFSSYNKIVRSTVATAKRCWLCDHDMPHTRFGWFCNTFSNDFNFERDLIEKILERLELNICLKKEKIYGIQPEHR